MLRSCKTKIWTLLNSVIMNSLTLAYPQMKLTHLPYFRSNWDSSLKPNDCIRFPFSLESCQDFHIVRSETQPWIGTETRVKSKFYQHLTSTFLGFNTFANTKWIYQLISLFKDHTAHIKPLEIYLEVNSQFYNLI